MQPPYFLRRGLPSERNKTAALEAIGKNEWHEWQTRFSQTCLYGFLPYKSLEVTYGSVKIIFETKINCFAFRELPKHHFVCKTTKNEQQLLRQNYPRPRHHQLLPWQVPKSEWFPSGFRALPKTHLKPHFAHFRAFSYKFIFLQIRFRQPILR